MAKATRMQNGLRCTYIVARYGKGGAEASKLSDNVKQGEFIEKVDCKDVFKRLVSFEMRNQDKVKMVDREKQLARLDFLQKLKVCNNVNSWCIIQDVYIFV